MYILEITNHAQRREMLLSIINSIYQTSFPDIEAAFIIQGLSYLEHSAYTKTEKISIKDIHELKRKLWISLEDTKLVIINNAHQLTTEAQNALLKDLEEEPENTITILAAADITQLLPTIKSRGLPIKSHEIGLIHPILAKEKFAKMVYNTNDLAYIGEFLNLPLYDQLAYIKRNLENPKKTDKQNSQPISGKQDLVESFLKDLLLYYECSLSQEGYMGKRMLVERGLEKIHRGVKSYTVLIHTILTLQHG